MTHYEWSIDNPTTIHEHSKAKHQVYREYVKRYLRERVVRPTFDRYCINIIDGFAGGGIYASGPTRNVYYGSPIILLETLHEMQAELQARQSKPFLLDYNVHFVDVSSEAIATLADVLKARGFGHLISNRVFLHRAVFQDIAPSLIDRVVGRGRSIFILDQYGYTDVPFNLIQTIFSTLKKPEVILTFGYDWLANFVQDYARLSKMLISIGVGPINRNEYDALRGTHRGVGLMIQRHLQKAFLRIAPYFTPFFITSRESNTAYWLLHLSSHPRARDVMAGLHWEVKNHFAHFGAAGYDMLGFDPAQPPDGTQEFLFDEDALGRAFIALRESIPSLVIKSGDDGVAFGDFFKATCNFSPADSRIIRRVVAGLAEDGLLSIKTEAGRDKRSLTNLGPLDRLIVPRQRPLIMTGGQGLRLPARRR